MPRPAIVMQLALVLRDFPMVLANLLAVLANDRIGGKRRHRRGQRLHDSRRGRLHAMCAIRSFHRRVPLDAPPCARSVLSAARMRSAVSCVMAPTRWVRNLPSGEKK